ncbi:MAG: alpha-hydroxy acid oxidase [Hyphomicrobiaceae bacterium]
MSLPHPPPVSLADYERLAEGYLAAGDWAYVAGGAGDEITVRWNSEAFAKLAIVPRVLRRSDQPSTALTVLGETLAHPIMIAPLAYQKLVHPDGELATALAAAAQDTLMILSTLSTTPMRDAIGVEGSACRWFQLYMQPSRAATLRLVRAAEEAGYTANVMTVDATLSGVRNHEERNGFRLPPHVRPVNLNIADATETQEEAPSSLSTVFRAFLKTAPAWQDVEWLVGETRLPVALKGVLSPVDAVTAVETGAAAIIVSNHGGRTLDTLPASVEMLPAVRDAVAGRVPILVDGGIRRGTDVLKCLALGARAVLIGRPVMHGLAVAGALGVAHVLRLLRDEFEIAMALTGCMSVSDLTAECLRPA